MPTRNGHACSSSCSLKDNWKPCISSGTVREWENGLPAGFFPGRAGVMQGSALRGEVRGLEAIFEHLRFVSGRHVTYCVWRNVNWLEPICTMSPSTRR